MRQYAFGRRLIFSLVLATSTLFYFGCKNEANITTPAALPVKLKVPVFDKDSAFAYIQTQVDFGPRVPGTEAHKCCGDWMVGRLKACGARVIEQPFTGKTFSGISFQARNIIASFNEKVRPRIILAAHWDTRFIADQDPEMKNKNTPLPGADDGGSGVGVLLEIARQLQANPIPNLGIDLLFFDAEDQGGEGSDPESWCQGAQHWALHKHTAGYQAKYGILLDMVGGKSPRFTKEGTSVQYASAFVDKVWTLAQRMGYGNYFVNEVSPAIIDDHYFINRMTNIPMIDIINRPTNNEFVAHWHTLEDKIENIDREALKATGQVVLAVIYREANGDL